MFILKRVADFRGIPYTGVGLALNEMKTASERDRQTENQVKRKHAFIVLFFFQMAGIFGAYEEIKNSSIPVFGEFKPEWKEQDLFREDRMYGFGSSDRLHPSMQIDSRGMIYVLFSKGIHVYDNNGNLRKTLFEIRGQGPGEMPHPPYMFFITQNDYFYVTDDSRTALFGADGNFIRNFTKSSYPYLISSKQEWAACEYLYDGIRSFNILRVYDSELSHRKELHRVLNTHFFHTTYYSHRYSPLLLICMISPDLFIYGDNQEYRLFVSDFKGNVRRAFSKKEKKYSVSSREIEALRKTCGTNSRDPGNKNMPKPAYRPYFKEFLSDEKGRIYVIRIKSVLDKSQEEEVDIFSSDGRYLYQTRFPFMPRVIRNGVAYTLEQRADEDGDLYHIGKRLTLLNYSSMKFKANEK